MKIVQLVLLKAGLRRFIAEDTSTEVVLTWNANEDHLKIERDRRGIDITFPAGSLNSEGDPLTSDEKQSIIENLSAIVDEHNSQVLS